jgi:predicted ATP-grasp superfamily ATP-dependent carboligase
MRVLVTYGRNPKSLAVVRSLANAGHEVFVSDSIPVCLSAYSRHCAGFILTPNPSHSPSEFIECIDESMTTRQLDFIIPMDDAECDVLYSESTPDSIHRAMVMPDYGQYLVARFKNLTIAKAKSLGISVPASCVATSISEVVDCTEAVGHPAILKPTKSSGSRGLVLFTGPESIPRAEKALQSYGQLLVQEYIPHGGSVGVSLLLDHGDVKATFSHRRVLEYPDAGGPSIIRESIRNEQAEDNARKLMESLRWHGVAMVEFVIDPRHGSPVLMEINPRFWGSLPLAIASGVDFPHLLCDVFQNKEINRVETYRLGVTCVKLTPSGVVALFGHNGMARGRTILRSAFNCDCFDVESFSDPMPSLGGMLMLMYLLVAGNRGERHGQRWNRN